MDQSSYCQNDFNEQNLRYLMFHLYQIHFKELCHYSDWFRLLLISYKKACRQMNQSSYCQNDFNEQNLRYLMFHSYQIHFKELCIYAFWFRLLLISYKKACSQMDQSSYYQIDFNEQNLRYLMFHSYQIRFNELYRNFDRFRLFLFCYKKLFNQMD